MTLTPTPAAPARRRLTPIALTIAGSDSGGGAGVQADLKTFSALGVYGASVLTAVTAQNTRAVTAVLALPADLVRAQIDAVLDDLAVAAIKIGMLHGVAIIETVAAALARRPPLPVVLDPVMIAKSGAALLDRAALRALIELVLPRATLLTPNLPEAAALLGCEEAWVQKEPELACDRLRALGPSAIVLKGGHAGGQRSDDLLATAKGKLWLPAARLPTRSTHGTGCTFSAALAAALAHGLELGAAARAAKRYITQAIAAADTLQLYASSDGPDSPEAKTEDKMVARHGPVHHFFALWPGPKDGDDDVGSQSLLGEPPEPIVGADHRPGTPH